VQTDSTNSALVLYLVSYITN